ncbi:hypothetical protein NS183_18720 [Microbacterium testaceum]|nr:hypothetical protein NS183_18720 [Microbacterium testaceum]
MLGSVQRCPTRVDGGEQFERRMGGSELIASGDLLSLEATSIPDTHTVPSEATTTDSSWPALTCVMVDPGDDATHGVFIATGVG